MKYQTQNRKKERAKYNILILIVIFCSILISGEWYKTALAIDNTNITARVGIPNIQISVKDYAWEQSKKAGLDPVHFVMIIECESGWKSDAVNVNRNGTYDIGLVQWNSIHKIGIQDKLDPYKSIDLMISYRLKSGSYKAWTCANKMGIIK